MSTPSLTISSLTPSLFSNVAPGKKDSYDVLVAITACVSDGAAGAIVFTQSHDPEIESACK
jgi:hypothetical protein